MDRPELLAPAGDLEKLKTAVRYGADAVYCGGRRYGLRAHAGNLTRDELESGVRFAHSRGVAVYVTVNIVPKNSDYRGLPSYLRFLGSIGVDGIIVSDPGIMSVARERVPGLPLHLSTQAGVASWPAASFWERQGVERVILARELSLGEIREIAGRITAGVEVFVHGAMCISHSGRCLLSSYLTGRDANRGECAQPCRWKYYLREEKRPGLFHPVEEDGRGTYILNSRDLCLLGYIPELVGAGVRALKIEGRMKSVHYVATVTRVYRRAIDAYLSDPGGFGVDPRWRDELKKVSHRGYTTGFIGGNPGAGAQRYSSSDPIRTHEFVGIIRGYEEGERRAVMEIRNRVLCGQRVEIFGPGTESFSQRLEDLRDEDSGEPLAVAPHPHQMVSFACAREIARHHLVRRPMGGDEP